MIKKVLLQALSEGNVREFIYQLNKRPCNAQMLSALTQVIAVTNNEGGPVQKGIYLSPEIRKNILTFYQCYEYLLDNNFRRKNNQARRNIQRIPDIAYPINAKELFESAMQDNRWEEILNLLTTTRTFNARSLWTRDKIITFLLREMLNLIKANLLIREKWIIFTIFQKIFTDLFENNFLRFAEIDSKQQLLELIEFLKELAEFLVESGDAYLLREISFNKVSLYGISLATLHLRDIPVFIASPQKFLAKEGASLKKQLAAELLKSDLNGNHLSLCSKAYWNARSELNERFRLQLQSALDKCSTIGEFRFLKESLNSLNPQEARAILNDDPHNFTDEQARCYQQFMQELLEGEENPYFAAFLRFIPTINLRADFSPIDDEAAILRIETLQKREHEIEEGEACALVVIAGAQSHVSDALLPIVENPAWEASIHSPAQSLSQFALTQSALLGRPSDPPNSYKRKREEVKDEEENLNSDEQAEEGLEKSKKRKKKM